MINTRNVYTSLKQYFSILSRLNIIIRLRKQQLFEHLSLDSRLLPRVFLSSFTANHEIQYNKRSISKYPLKAALPIPFYQRYGMTLCFFFFVNLQICRVKFLSNDERVSLKNIKSIKYDRVRRSRIKTKKGARSSLPKAASANHRDCLCENCVKFFFFQTNVELIIYFSVSRYTTQCGRVLSSSGGPCPRRRFIGVFVASECAGPRRTDIRDNLQARTPTFVTEARDRVFIEF